MSDNVYIIGVSMTKFGKYLDRSIKCLTGEALRKALKDCDLERKDLEAAWFSNTGWGMTDFQHCIRGQVALSANGLDKIPITNVENACVSASTALHGAWTGVKAGLYDCVLAIGAEKVYSETDRPGIIKQTTFASWRRSMENNHDRKVMDPEKWTPVEEVILKRRSTRRSKKWRCMRLHLK